MTFLLALRHQRGMKHHIRGGGIVANYQAGDIRKITVCMNETTQASVRGQKRSVVRCERTHAPAIRTAYLLSGVEYQ
jgi:hypothetical protein